jgi:hypothetical protein
MKPNGWIGRTAVVTRLQLFVNVKGLYDARFFRFTRNLYASD